MEVFTFEDHASGVNVSVEIKIPVSCHRYLVAKWLDGNLFLPVEFNGLHAVNPNPSALKIEISVNA